MMKENNDSRFDADFDKEEVEIAANMRSASSRGAGSCPKPELFSALAEGVLPNDFAQSLLDHIHRCPLCRSLQRDIPFLEPTAASEEQLRRMRPAVVRDRRPSRVRWWHPALALGFAAIIAVAILTNPLHVSSPASPLPKQVARLDQPFEVAITKAPIEIPDSLLATRGAQGTQPSLDEWTLALRPYKEDDYAAAVSTLKGITRQYPEFADGFFYLGVSLLMAKNPADAVTALEQASKLDTRRKAEIGWYMGSAYARMGRRSPAISAWEPVCSGKSDYSSRACDAIHGLNSSNLQ